MYNKKIYVAIIAFTIFLSVADAKKMKKIKEPPPYETEERNPQPNIIPYSTFGFNDVGSYDGFVPSSPDYANYINDDNQESTTRLYAPAFPTALESFGYVNKFETQSLVGQDYILDEDNVQQSSALQYPQNINHFLNSPNQENANKNSDAKEYIENNENDANSSVYGAKLNFRTKNKANQFNKTELNLYNSDQDNRPKYGESDFKYPNLYTNVVTNPPTGIEHFAIPVNEKKQNLLNFPRVVDFTKMMQIRYPAAMENIPTSIYSNTQNENLYSNSYKDNSHKFPKQLSFTEGAFHPDSNEDPIEENDQKLNSYDGQTFSYGYSTFHNKNTAAEVKPNLKSKKKQKNKHWIQNKNHTNEFENWRDGSSLKGFDYSINDFDTSFNYGSEATRKPTTINFDEIVPDSSKLIDFTKDQFDDADFSNFNKMPNHPDVSDYNSVISNKPKPYDYSNPDKHLIGTTPTATSYWGNVFKSSDYSSFKPHHLNKLPYNDEQKHDDVVSITNRPNKYSSINRPTEIKSSNWAYDNQNPFKSSKPPKDWSKELYNKYKSEEDLLSLRNQDTSHSSYLPIQKPYDNGISNDDYKNVLEKWKQSYLKAKYKNSHFRDYEAFGTEAEPLHVPIPKPYSIEIPHPVIVPVPQPYPVRVPIAKPVAVPVLRELTVPIEKPVLYPVYKKVPYPIEKLIPVTVEKEVRVPVVKPYPVRVPYVRPVFHHTKSMYDEIDSDKDDEDDYMPRPESSKKNVHYKRRPYSSRTQTRRPSHGSYQDRSRRFWPDKRRPSASTVDKRYKKPYGEEYHAISYKYPERDTERLKNDHSAYMLYCKRRGTC